MRFRAGGGGARALRIVPSGGARRRDIGRRRDDRREHACHAVRCTGRRLRRGVRRSPHRRRPLRKLRARVREGRSVHRGDVRGSVHGRGSHALRRGVHRHAQRRRPLRRMLEHLPRGQSVLDRRVRRRSMRGVRRLRALHARSTMRLVRDEERVRLDVDELVVRVLVLRDVLRSFDESWRRLSAR